MCAWHLAGFVSNADTAAAREQRCPRGRTVRSDSSARAQLLTHISTGVGSSSAPGSGGLPPSLIPAELTAAHPGRVWIHRRGARLQRNRTVEGSEHTHDGDPKIHLYICDWVFTCLFYVRRCWRVYVWPAAFTISLNASHLRLHAYFCTPLNSNGAGRYQSPSESTFHFYALTCLRNVSSQHQ